ncbi:MAG TPA: SUF system Fe-S cluster assembly protein [Acetobacteraceae bacterium]|nr:SUF system Fe-S cluster assembly protein [Acetobacteraceae bacterium]
MNDPTPVRHTSWTPDGEIAATQVATQAGAPTEPKPTEEALIAAISNVYDPEIPVNIYELGLIYTIDINDDGRVKVEMTLTAPACPSAQELPVQVQDAVMSVPGVIDCEVDTVWDPPWDPSRMTEEARLQLNMY